MQYQCNQCYKCDLRSMDCISHYQLLHHQMDFQAEAVCTCPTENYNKQASQNLLHPIKMYQSYRICLRTV